MVSLAPPTVAARSKSDVDTVGRLRPAMRAKIAALRISSHKMIGRKLPERIRNWYTAADKEEISAMALVGSISQQIWDMKYRLRSASGEMLDKTIEDTWRRVAMALAAPERAPPRCGPSGSTLQ